MAYPINPATVATGGPYGSYLQGFGPAATATGLTNISGVVAPGFTQQGLSAANFLPVTAPYSGYGALTAEPLSGYRPAANIPPISGPTGFNVSGLSSWSGYSAGTVTLAPSASGYGYGAGYQFSGPRGWGSTVTDAPIPGGPIFPRQQQTGVFPSVISNGVQGVLPTTVIDQFIPPTATQRIAPPPPTVAPAGYE